MAVFGRLQVAGEFEERWMKPLWLTVVLLTLPLTLQAQQSLEQAQQQSQALVDDAVAAQQRINELDQATRAALEAYRHAVTQADALIDYSERMQQLVASQADEIASLQQQIDSVADTQREMLPLIRRMIESLDAFIALDLPFLLGLPALLSLLAGPACPAGAAYPAGSACPAWPAGAAVPACTAEPGALRLHFKKDWQNDSRCQRTS